MSSRTNDFVVNLNVKHVGGLIFCQTKLKCQNKKIKRISSTKTVRYLELTKSLFDLFNGEINIFISFDFVR